MVLAVLLLALPDAFLRSTFEFVDLRATRLKHSISIDLLAFRTGVERSRISRAERGFVQLKDDERKRIAAFFGVAANKLTTPTTIDG